MECLKHLNEYVDAVTPYEPGRPIEDVARELGLVPENIIKIASNENPLGPSPSALRAMKKSFREMHLYPDGGGYYLRTKLAEKYGLLPANIVLGNGSNEILTFIAQCFMGNGKSVVASAHAFVIYKILAQMTGTEFIEVPTKNLGHDLTAMRKAIRPDTSVIFICNPNNPTGTFLRQGELKRFMGKVPEDVLVVFDEAYAEICLTRMPDTLNYIYENRNAVVLRTFSKGYGLAGLRIGYGLAAEPIAEALQKPRQPFNTTRMSQMAATAALDDEAFLRRSRKVFRKGRVLLEETCRELALEFVPSVANFMLIKVGDGLTVTQELQKRGVIVRPMVGYGLGEYIRVSFGTENENLRFVKELKEVLK